MLTKNVFHTDFKILLAACRIDLNFDCRSPGNDSQPAGTKTKYTLTSHD